MRSLSLLTVAACVIAGALFPVRSAQSSQSAPTFNKDVAPIVYANCVSCHRPGELAPMSLLTYETAQAYAPRIKEMVSTRQMPPCLPIRSLATSATRGG